MNWIKKTVSILVSRDSVFVLISTFTLFLLVNFMVVFFSPFLVKNINPHFVKSISPCYRTLYHIPDSPNTGRNFGYEVIFGDSYSEGAGDEYILGDKEYGIFRKLHGYVDRTFLIFGRSGYGSHRTLLEEQRCSSLLDGFTSFNFQRINVTHASFVFYEGNDLTDNLIQSQLNFSEMTYKLRFFLPLFEFSYKTIRSLIYKVENWLVGFYELSLAQDGVKQGYPVSTSNIKLQVYPQSAPVELTSNQMANSFKILEQSLVSIRENYPGRTLQFLYLPSVASSYEFESGIAVSSYRSNPYFLSTGEENSNTSGRIRSHIKKMALKLGWEFCDVSEDVLNLTKGGVAAHGPIDWQHFNKDGYTVVSNKYLSCFVQSEKM